MAEIIFCMAKTVWGGREGMAEIIFKWQSCLVVENIMATAVFFAEALNSLHLIARAMRRRSPSAKRANREAESGLRCKSVVK
jgi:hypothetical protein